MLYYFETDYDKLEMHITIPKQTLNMKQCGIAIK